MSNLLGYVNNNFKHLFMDIIDGKSTRVQLVWATFFSWWFGLTWFLIFIPIVREISVIYYRQNSIIAQPINLDLPAYGTTILGMLGTAFMATVAGYIASNWATYKQQDPNYGINKLNDMTKKPETNDKE